MDQLSHHIVQLAGGLVRRQHGLQDIRKHQDGILQSGLHLVFFCGLRLVETNKTRRVVRL